MAKRGRKPKAKERFGTNPYLAYHPKEDYMDPLILMVERNLITTTQQWCGERFGALFRASVPVRLNPKGTLDMEQSGLPIETPQDAAREWEYARASDALRRESRQVFDAVVNVTVFGRYPIRQVTKLRKGLKLLEKLWCRAKAA